MAAIIFSPVRETPIAPCAVELRAVETARQVFIALDKALAANPFTSLDVSELVATAREVRQ
jgi:hypothetical protein